MPYITEIFAREVLDSFGNPTVETEVFLESGAYGRVTLPSLINLGKNIQELRDSDNKRFNNLGCKKAVSCINKEIAKMLIGEDVRDQVKIDKKLTSLDSTITKSKLGSNSIESVSIAVSKAASDYSGLPLYSYLGGFNGTTLPTPIVSLIESDNGFSEYSIMPVGAESFSQALSISKEISFSLEKILSSKNIALNVNAYGAFKVCGLKTTSIFDMIVDSIKNAGYSLNKDVTIMIKVDSNRFYNNESKKYLVDGNELSSDNIISLYQQLINKYSIQLIEDGMADLDPKGLKLLESKFGKKIGILSTSVYGFDSKKLQKGINERYSNMASVELNQFGTLTDLFEYSDLIKRNGLGIVLVSSLYDTEDTFLADLSVALNSKLIKIGGMMRSERITKYNQLLRIEEALSISAKYAGKKLK